MDRLIPTTEIKSEIHIKLDPDLLPPNTSFKIKKEEPDLGRTPSPNPRDRERFEDEFVEVDSGSDSEAEEAVDPNFEGFVEEGGQKYFVSKGLRIRQISDSSVRSYKVGPLYTEWKKGNVVLGADAEQQGDEWDDFRASNLITSLMMGYYIPPVIFKLKDKTIKDKKTGAPKTIIEGLRVCVDGKQRLKSVFRFMDGKIPFTDSTGRKKWYWSHPIVDGKEVPSERNVISAVFQSFINAKCLVCIEYQKLTKENEEMMFQLGDDRTPAERMRAMSCPLAVLCRQYEEEYASIWKLNIVKRKPGNGTTFKLVLILVLEIQEVVSSRRTAEGAASLKASPSILFSILNDNRPIEPAWERNCKKVFDTFQRLVKICSEQSTATTFTPRKNSVFDPIPDWLGNEEVAHTRTFSPMELIVTGTLICARMEEDRSDDELLLEIKELRYFLRKHHEGLRTNNLCWNTAWEFINANGEAERRFVSLSDDEGVHSDTTKKKKKGKAKVKSKGKAGRPRKKSRTAGKDGAALCEAEGKARDDRAARIKRRRNLADETEDENDTPHQDMFPGLKRRRVDGHSDDAVDGMPEAANGDFLPEQSADQSEAESELTDLSSQLESDVGETGEEGGGDEAAETEAKDE